MAWAARPTFPRVGTASSLPQSMHSPISHHRAASARMAGVRLGVARDRPPAAPGLVLAMADTVVCPTGIRHGRDRGRIIKPADRPLMRFLSLSALAGRDALDRRCRLRTDAASALAIGAPDVHPGLRASPLRFFAAVASATGSVRHVVTVNILEIRVSRDFVTLTATGRPLHVHRASSVLRASAGTRPGGGSPAMPD